MSSNATQKPTKVRIRARISYPDLVEGKVDDKSGKRKWSAAFVFEAGYDLTPLKKAALAVLEDKFGKEKAKDMIKKGQIVLVGGKHAVIRNDERYGPGEHFINARSTRKPQCVSRYPDPKDPSKPAKIPDDKIADELYPGAVVNAYVEAFWFEHPENKGISWSLGNIQKWEDADRFDNFTNAQEEFSPDEDAAPDLDGLDDTSTNEDDSESIDDLLN